MTVKGLGFLCAGSLLGGSVLIEDSKPVPLGTPPPVQFPKDNPFSESKAKLGEALFFEGKMSKTGQTPCTWCHVPGQGFGDVRNISTGDKRETIRRHTPSLNNVGYAKVLFWDGRETSLEKQSMMPIAAHDEMDMDLKQLPEILSKAGYKSRFKAAFGTEEITVDRIAKALTTYERTLTQNNLPFDQYIAGDKLAMPEAAVKGLKLFEGKAGCVNCHGGPHFSNAFIPGKEAFAVTGVQQPGSFDDDWGRMEITKNEKDRSAFKIPTLRGIGDSSPYMHTGHFKNLREVIEFYNRGGDAGKLPKLNLTDQEKSNLLSFLREGLTGDE